MILYGELQDISNFLWYANRRHVFVLVFLRIQIKKVERVPFTYKIEKKNTDSQTPSEVGEKKTVWQSKRKHFF